MNWQNGKTSRGNSQLKIVTQWDFKWSTWFISETDVNLLPAVITFNFVGKLGITASYCTIITYAPEMYPTNIRYDCTITVGKLSFELSIRFRVAEKYCAH